MITDVFTTTCPHCGKSVEVETFQCDLCAAEEVVSDDGAEVCSTCEGSFCTTHRKHSHKDGEPIERRRRK